MAQGRIMKALSGFYYVDDGQALIPCRGRGKLRRAQISPLVGDYVRFTALEDGQGAIDEILPRNNQFARPAVANIDQILVVSSEAVPVTVPFLIDRVSAIAQHKHCRCVVCVNKSDLAAGDGLMEIYTRAGFSTCRVSAQTGEGIEQLKGLLKDKLTALTGNSGVGKSSLLNALEPGTELATGSVSQKLGRGRHTTRHVELFRLSFGGVLADTPGFSSLDVEEFEGIEKEALAACFIDFLPYLGTCRFPDCTHVKERSCAILAALEAGEIQPTRHESYVRLYEQAKLKAPWERNQK